MMPKTQQAAPQLAQSQQENSGSDDRDGISDSEDGFIPVKNKKKAKKGKTYQCKGEMGNYADAHWVRMKMRFSVKAAATGFTPTVRA